jgi:catechol-2,3-dioxygenase
MQLDRLAIAVSDLVEAEEFYVRVLGKALGGRLANRYGLTTEEVIQARKAARLATRHGEPTDPVAAVLPFSRVMLGQAHLYLCLAERHLPEPPPEQLRGTPRFALRASAAQLTRAMEVFAEHGVPFEGPVEWPAPHPVAGALYFKDPSGNFLELCCPRTGVTGS